MSKDPDTLYLEAIEQEKSLRAELIAGGEREERLEQLSREIIERYRKAPSQAELDAFKRIWAASQAEPQPSAPLRPPQSPAARHSAHGGPSVAEPRPWVGREAAAVGGVKRRK